MEEEIPDCLEVFIGLDLVLSKIVDLHWLVADILVEVVLGKVPKETVDWVLICGSSVRFEDTASFNRAFIELIKVFPRSFHFIKQEIYGVYDLSILIGRT